jgi:predicted AlkP superfamily pyrophosphatase or phosphodiesterase
VLLRSKGLLSGGLGQPKGDAWVLSEGGTAAVYVTNPDRKAHVVSELRKILAGAEGIDHLYGEEDFPKLGLPVPAVTDQAPDLVLAAVPDYMFSNESEGDFVTEVAAGGTHGYINTDPKMQAIFIAWGAGIPQGVRISTISNLDVAPTIAALLGLEIKQAKGHAIREIVRHATEQ